MGSFPNQRQTVHLLSSQQNNVPEGVQPYPLPALPQGSAALSSASPSPRECSLILFQPLPEEVQPYPLPALPQGSAALSPASPSPRECSLILCQPPSRNERSLVPCQHPPRCSTSNIAQVANRCLI